MSLNIQVKRNRCFSTNKQVSIIEEESAERGLIIAHNAPSCSKVWIQWRRCKAHIRMRIFSEERRNNHLLILMLRAAL